MTKTNASSEIADIRQIVDFVAVAERLKRELRHSWLADGRRESVGEHTWMMGLLALMLHSRLDQRIDIIKVLKMVLVHDIAEALVGDIPFFEESERKRNKAVAESEAIERIRKLLPDDIGMEIKTLWQEFEDRQTPEAKFACALDNLEVQIQHNLAEFITWEPIEQDLVYTKVLQPCAHDQFLSAMAKTVIADAEAKMAEHGVDVDVLRQKHGFA
ncbi:MAG: HD domain-containing protein [Nostoc sp. DedSLP03]|uniref:HD domain-containing protein n=1 Tax=Nostoc sp. DedSLP03 TaxID=3075400 RepID=UPI002AD55086|nr:HD domain-containing protein [Nostoc sp. DedSLP03]MDZ7970271.1 HD domain-containing protein [Nostoc sp. DedSLP03]